MQRPPLGDGAKSPLEAVLCLPSRYSSMADDDGLAKGQREAAMLFSVAEGQLSTGDIKDCLKTANQASLIFKELGDRTGIADICALTVRALRLNAEAAGAKPEEALNLAREECARFAREGCKRGEACMQLVLAETYAAMRRGSKNLAGATESASAALITFQELRDKSMEAATHLVMVGIHYQRGVSSDTMQAANEALRLFRETGGRKGEAKALHALGLACTITEDFSQAVSRAGEALQIYRELGDDVAQAFELQVLSQWHMAHKVPPKAVVCALEAVGLYSTMKNGTKGEVVALLIASEAMIANGRERQALKLVREGVARFRERQDQRGVIACLEVVVHTALFLDTLEVAVQAAKEALELARDLGDQRLELSMLHAACAVSSQCNEFEEALQAMRDAGELAQDLNDLDEEAFALRAICNLHMSLGDIRTDTTMLNDTVQCAKDAMFLFKKSGYLSGEGSCATILATLKDSNSDLLEAAKEAQAIFQEAEDAMAESSAWKLIIEAYLLDKDYDEALNAANARAELWRGIGKNSQLADALLKVANIHFTQDSHDSAEEAALEARKFAQGAGDQATEASALLLLTQIYVLHMSKEELPKNQDAALPPPFLQARDKAYRSVKGALDLSCKTSDRGLRASVLFWRAEVLVWTFRGREALSSAVLADKMFGKVGNLSGQVHTQVLIADLHLMMSEKSKAKAVAQAALGLATSMLDGQDEEAAVLAVLERIEGKKEAPVMQMVQQIMQDDSDAGAQVQQVRLAARSLAIPEVKGLDPGIVKVKVIDLVKNVLASDDDEIELDSPLMEAGVDSLGSVQLVTDIGREFSMSLSPSAVFDFPTISALVEHVVEESGN